MAAKKERSLVRPELLALYDAAIADISDVERKGATVPYTSHNGHMFSLMDDEGTLAIRLPKEELEIFLKKYKTSLRQAYGIVQKEYALVPLSLLKKTSEFKPWMWKSFDYVNRLKPKPTKATVTSKTTATAKKSKTK